MSTSTTRWLSTTTHAALAAASGYLGKIWKSSGRRQTGSHKDRTWCLLTPSPTLQRPTTLRLGTPRASSYGCSARALLSPSYLHLPWARHMHTHTECRHKHTVYTNTCSAWGHKHKQGTQAPETPLFPVWVCVPMLSMCVYTHMCLHQTCLCVRVCVCVCVSSLGQTQR